MMRCVSVLALLLALALPALGQPLDIVVLGDSNTWLGGDDCSKPRGWNTWFKEALQPASCRSYARSGATWTHTPATKRNLVQDIGVLGDDNVVYNQIERLKEAHEKGRQPAPQLIVVAAGTNDAWFAEKRPHAFDKTVAQAFTQQEGPAASKSVNEVLTLAEAVRYDCELLMEAFPDARLLLLTPLQSTAVTAELISRTGDIIEGCGRKMELAVIRMDHDGCVCATDERVKKRYTYDGTHTSEEGARRNGYLVAQRVREMMKTE
ncbi:MAG: SGNH/GDSL hydrolase family protein [Prevotella sp.]|nr:SGNH/GDSL hydrolase family protein [Prevotella sp.]